MDEKGIIIGMDKSRNKKKSLAVVYEVVSRSECMYAVDTKLSWTLSTAQAEEHSHIVTHHFLSI